MEDNKFGTEKAEEVRDLLSGGADGAGTQRSTYMLPPKKLFELDGKDRTSLPLFILASVLTVFWGICSGFRSGFTVSYLILFTVLTVYLKDKERRCRPLNFVRGILCILLSAVFSMDHTVLSFYAMILLFAESVLFFDGLVRDREENGDTALIGNILSAFFPNAFGSAGTAFASVIAGAGERGKKSWPALKGILLSLPAAAVILVLLISGDAAFEGLMSGLFENVPENAVKFVFGLILSVFVTGFAWGLKKNGAEDRPPRPLTADIRTVTAFLSVIACIYTVYLFSQSAYFFSAFSGMLPDGYSFTVAEYARRGFFEMCMIALIDLVIVFTAAAKTSDESVPMPSSVKALSLFICAFTLVIASTAISKMAMYISVYGMTFKRVITSAFMAGLCFVFVVLAVRLFRPRTKVLRSALAAAAAVVLLLSFGNVNGFIAKYNYERYADGSLKTVDMYHMYTLGDAGVEYLVLLSHSGSDAVRLEAEDQLRNACYDRWYTEYDSRYGLILREKMRTHWYEMTFSSVKADRLLEERIAESRDFLRDLWNER